MTIPYDTYDTRLGLMLKEAIPTSEVAVLGQAGVNWWKYGISDSTTLDVGRDIKHELITFIASYVISSIDGGNKGPTRAEIMTKLASVKEYFIARSNMVTSTQTVSADYIAGLVPGTLKAKYTGLRTSNKDVTMDFALTFKHLITTKTIED